MDLGFEIFGENAYRIFYQALQKLKEQLNPSATRLISLRPGEYQEDVAREERLSVIIREQFGDVNVVLLVFVLVLLSAANQDTLVVYQKAYNDGQGESRRGRRVEELEQQVMDVQKRLVKLQKENEQVWYGVTRVAVEYVCLTYVVR